MKSEIDDDQRAAVCEWARANGLDPEKIHEDIAVVSDSIISYSELTENEAGQVSWVPHTVPLREPFDRFRRRRAQ